MVNVHKIMQQVSGNQKSKLKVSAAPPELLGENPASGGGQRSRAGSHSTPSLRNKHLQFCLCVVSTSPFPVCMQLNLPLPLL